MSDLHFYHWDQDDASGLRRPLMFVRRLVRRLLRPTFQRLLTILQEFDHRIDQNTREIQLVVKRQEKSEAHRLDQEALLRRLAALEDHVDTLLQHQPRPELRLSFPMEQSSAHGETAKRACG